MLTHRRLRDWALQLYGVGKMDEDALNAAVAWMEEHGGLINDCANDEKGGERMSSFNTAYLVMTDAL